MKHTVWQRLILSPIVFAALLNVSCTTAQMHNAASGPQSESGVDYESLAAISEALGSGIEKVLKNHVQGASVEVLLAFALYVDTNQFRNTYNVTNPATGLQATRQEFFLLSDNMFPLDGGRSVMRTYETVVESATCERGKISDPGCILLRKAGADLATGKLEPSMFRQGWPGWRPLGANPETWAEDETEWTTLTIMSDEFTVETEYLYVKLTRGWLSEDFLGSSGWYINGECRGFVSDGDLGNDGTSDEFFPRMPVGLLFTRKLEIRRNNESFFKLTPTYLSGWVHKSIPLSPKQSDPCKKSCPDHDRIAPRCAGRPTN